MLNFKYHISYFFVLIVFLSACSGIHKISNNDLSYLYKKNKQPIDAQFFVYHFNNDSSRLYAKIPVKDILYKRNDAGVMESHLSLRLLVFPSYEIKKFTDSLLINFSPAYVADSGSYILKSFSFKQPVTKKAVLQISLRDLTRHTSTDIIIETDNDLQSPQSFLVVDAEKNFPVFTNLFGEEKKLKIISSDPTKPIYVRTFSENFPMAYPPFSNKIPQTFSYNSDSFFVLLASNENVISLTKKGIYHLQYDTLQKTGLSIMRFDDDFPAITDAGNLIEALRYITTNDEYKKLLNATDKNEAVDKYWMELSGNKERARFLIKTFYSRVQKANESFTSYLEGWKTDRGMIYIVFGPPQVVYRSNVGEYWDYGNFPGYGNLNFSFNKIKNPFTNEDYVLVRQSSYEPVWYLGVENWRQGRVSGVVE